MPDTPELDELTKEALKYHGTRLAAAHEARLAVDEQLKKVRGLTPNQFGGPVTTQESAILAALSIVSLIERHHLIAADAMVAMKALTDSTSSAAVALERTDKSTARLADSTKLLAYATIALVAATIGLGLVELMKPEAAPQVIVVPAPAPTINVPPSTVIAPPAPQR